MKKTAIILIPLILLALLWLIVTPYAVNKKFEKHLSDMGFKGAVIGKIDVQMGRVTARSIQLDDDAKTRIKTISIGASPISILLGHHINGVLIDGLTTQLEFKDIRSSIQDSSPPSFLKLINVPAENIEIKNFSMMIPAEKSAQNITGHIHLQATNESDVKTITGVLKNTSQISSLSTSLKGKMDTNANGVLNFDILDTDVNTAFFSINRANGWVIYKKESNSKIELSGQIDADSGSVLRTSAQNMSVILGKTNNVESTLNLMIRAQAATVKDVNISTDIHFSNIDQKVTFAQSVLSANDFGRFLDYIKKSHSAVALDLPALSTLKDTNISIRYLAEKRFADGPLPFDLKVISSKENIMMGTFLVYPDDLQVRGSAETSPTITDDIKSLLSLSEDQVSDNVVRLDGTIKGALF